MKNKILGGILFLLSLLPVCHHNQAWGQSSPSPLVSKAAPTPLINTPLARNEEEYYQGSLVSDRHPVVWGAVILMGLAWGGFLVFFSYKFLKTKPRSPESVDQDKFM